MAYEPPWKSDLQPATWRGVTFHVDEVSFKAGRRVAIHEYPFKDKPWVEDLGLGPQVIGFTGFLLGDDVASQYEEFKAACDQSGHGELVHPRLGSRTVALVSVGFHELKDAANVVSIQMEFLETTTYSGINQGTTSSATNFADALANISTASVGDFVRTAGAAIRSGQAAVQSVTSEVQGYVHSAQGMVRDATRAVNSVRPLANMLGVSNREFGRFMAPLQQVTTQINVVNRGVGSINRANYGTTQLLNGANRAAGLVETVGTRANTLARNI